MKQLVSIALLLASAASHAQPITVSDTSSSASGFFFGGTAGSFQSNVSHAHSVLPDGDYSFNLRGDVTAQFTGTATAFGFQAAAFFTLTTGAAPVQLSDIRVSYHGKEVLSGGSTASFSGRQFYRGQLYAPGFGNDFGYATYLADRTVQGVYIEDLSTPLASTLLAANTAYTLYMDVYPGVDITAYPASSSMLGYALEFGGTVAPFFDGVTVSFNAVAVPEPASLLLLGLGTALVLRGRRARRDTLTPA